MRNYFTNYQETNNKYTEQAATGVEHHSPNVNNILSNSKRNTEDTNTFVTPGCHQKWINIDNISVFDNPKQCFHILTNWYKISITAKDVQKIPHIIFLNKHGELAKDIQDFCQSQGITLALGDKYFADLLSCKELEHNLILILAVAKAHDFKGNQCGMPCYKKITVLMLLFQEAPHFVLLFSTTNMNLHLGKMIRNMDHRQSKTFDQYMINNVNHKIVLIEQERTGSSPQRQLYLKEFYTTAKLVASMY